MEPSPFAKKLSAIYAFFSEASRQTALSFDKSFFALTFIISAAIIFLFICGLDAAYNQDIGGNPEAGAGIEAPGLSRLQAASAAGIAPAQGTKNRPGGENPVDALAPQAGVRQTNAADPQANYRAQIIIPAIGVDSVIVMPTSADFAALNKSLTKGVVHYPGSALPWESGNTFLFGHSAGNFTVRSKAYAVFNRLAELRNGDIIRLQHGNSEYWYRVTSLAIKKADQALVDLVSTKRMVTLSTCNLFGAKDDRYVVEAEFMESYPLRSVSASGTSS